MSTPMARPAARRHYSPAPDDAGPRHSGPKSSRTTPDLPDMLDGEPLHVGDAAYTPLHAEQAAKFAELGATEFEIARGIGIDDRTFQGWLRRYPDLERAIKLGKDAADDRVTRALYHRAVGYTRVDRFGNETHVPPDAVACIFWLKNRRRSEWRDKYEIEQEHRHLHLHVAEKFRELDDDRIAQLLAERRALPAAIETVHRVAADGELTPPSPPAVEVRVSATETAPTRTTDNPLKRRLARHRKPRD